MDNWEAAANARDDVPYDAKQTLLLSAETMEGLRITGTCNSTHKINVMVFTTTAVRSFVDMARFLLSNDENLFLLSERISQDPLENYFGKQRARGGRNENQNLEQCACEYKDLLPVRGNCRRKRQLVMDDPPLSRESIQMLSDYTF